MEDFIVKIYTGTSLPATVYVDYQVEPYFTVNGGFFTILNAPTANTWSQTRPLIISNNLIMNNQSVYDFGWNKKLLFRTGASMEIVNNGGSVIMPHVAVEGCDKMWKGITVKTGATLDMSMMTSIKDAQAAITLQRGANVSASNCDFLNNNFAIRTDTTGTGSYSLSLLSNQYGATGAGLKPKYAGQTPAPLGTGFAGLYLDNAGAINLGSLFGQANQFFNLKYGIIAKSTDLTVRNTTFSNLTDISAGSNYQSFSNLYYSGKGIYTNGGSLDIIGNLISSGDPVVFDNCHTAVYSQATNLNVQECTMTGLHSGVIASAGFSKSYNITWNDISASDRGIAVFYQSGMPGQSTISYNTVRMNGNPDGIGIAAGGTGSFAQTEGTLLGNIISIDQGATGIYLGSADRLQVSKNIVRLAGAGARYGIRMEAGDRNTVNCNAIFNPGLGDNDGLYVIHASRARITCNVADGPARGLHFEGMLAGKNKANISGNTMQNNNAFGLVLGTDAVVGTQTHRGNIWDGTEASAGINADVSSKFIVDADENPDYLPDAWVPLSWFENILEPSVSFVCLPGSSCPLPTELPEEALDIKIAKGELIGEEYEAAQNWLAQRRFYERILEEENPYPGNADVSQFLTQAQSNGLAAYAELQVGIRQLGGMNENERLMEAASLLTQNNSLSGAEAYQLNEKTVNEIFLQTVAVGNLSFSEAQIIRLENIAAACPLSGGEAVLGARALLNLAHEEFVHIDDATACTVGERAEPISENLSVAKGQSIRMFPNPASNEVIVEYSGLDKIEKELVVFNVFGQTILTIALPQFQGHIRVPLAKLPIGVYWYGLSGTKNMIGKLIISR